MFWIALVTDCVGMHACCFEDCLPTLGPGGPQGVEIDVLGMTEDHDAALHAVEVLQARLDAQRQRRYFNIRPHLRLVAPPARDQ